MKYQVYDSQLKHQECADQGFIYQTHLQVYIIQIKFSNPFTREIKHLKISQYFITFENINIRLASSVYDYLNVITINKCSVVSEEGARKLSFLEVLIGFIRVLVLLLALLYA
ncbi:hypothetical protein FGO68_gene12016 [Halteria grandinella]|uniref:Transmembrane protein n=1 Tax=Halteria grandinella TaxID=5974 RepID=A0A8J8SU60_HALGN|nr:hypothetical protein FGO68_gene12016 [Halteria grandinella]